VVDLSKNIEGQPKYFGWARVAVAEKIINVSKLLGSRDPAESKA